MQRKLLGIYLNDHLAGSAAGVALVRRCGASNPQGELGAFLTRLVAEIERDQRDLQRLMADLGLPQNTIKVTAARALERLGRLKLNGQLRGYSGLSRFLELEALSVGIEGKRVLWRALEQIGVRSNTIDLSAKAQAAERQREELEGHRLAAAERAFVSGRAPN